MIRQGTGANASGAMWQAENRYDAAGRLVATNAGAGADGGVWKVFAYDRNGNQTGAIASAGAATSNASTFAGLLAAVGAANLNGTWTLYDGRGQATRVIEEGRDLSGTVTNQTLSTWRTYNAFGEIATETNALGHTVTYAYNTMGRKVRAESPAVEITDETGAAYWVKPSEDYYYDLGGRLVATRDASEGAGGANYAKTGTNAATAASKAANTGNLTTYVYLGASGYDGSPGLVALETHADGGRKQILYDRMGDARVIRDELYNPSSPNLHQEERTYNQLGQLTQVKHNRATDVSNDTTRLIDTYKYDQFGQRIQHSNNQITSPIYGEPVWVPYYYYDQYNFFGQGYGVTVDLSYWNTPIIGYTPSIEKTAYDVLGRVTVQADMAGQAAYATYTWDGTLTTSIGGAAVNLGGWVEAKSYANTTRTSTSKTDIYTREVWKSDLGGHVTTTAFDAGGRLTSRTVGSTTQTFQWYNTGLVKQNVSTSGTETYSYDAVGNRLTEKLVNGGVTFVDAQATYDALGRLTWWNQNAATYANGAASYTTPQVTNSYYYDANGNVRREGSTYGEITSLGAATSAVTRDYWFRYDAMNRLVVDRGVVLALGELGTTIVRSQEGTSLTYDAAGQRLTARRTDHDPGYWSWNGGTYEYIYGSYYETLETYVHDGAGRVVRAHAVESWGISELHYTGVVPEVEEFLAPGPKRMELTYDLMGRQLTQNDYAENGTTVVYSRSAAYDAAGKVTLENTSAAKPDGTWSAVTTYAYSASGQYLLGAVASQSSANSKNGSYQNSSTTTNTYQWWDAAQQGTIAFSQGGTTHTTTFA